MERQIAKICLLGIAQDGCRVSAGCLGQGAVAGAPSAVVVMAHRMVVIALHDQGRPCPDLLDHFPRLRSIVHEIAKHPKLVIRLWQGA